MSKLSLLSLSLVALLGTQVAHAVKCPDITPEEAQRIMLHKEGRQWYDALGHPGMHYPTFDMESIVKVVKNEEDAKIEQDQNGHEAYVCNYNIEDANHRNVTRKYLSYR